VETTLDSIDFELLAVLQNDVRISNKALAAAVGLSPSSCLARVRRLLRDRVITGFHADLRDDALGIGLHALIAVQLRQHSRDAVASFRAHALALPGVISLMHVSGEHDFLVHVAVRDAAHLRDLALDGFTARAEVARMQTSLIFEHARVPALPLWRAPGPQRRGRPPGVAQAPKRQQAGRERTRGRAKAPGRGAAKTRR
jgi:DNA-binding Lrp family transcriptional regulator